MTASANYIEIAQQHVGRHVDSVDGNAHLTIIGLSDDQQGDLSGKKVPYLVLQNDQQVVIAMHPRDAAKLMKTGETAKWKLAEAVDDSPEALLAQMQADLEAAKVEAASAKEAEDQPELSKKDLSRLIYIGVMKSSKKRADFVVRAVDELKLTPAGAKTYWSNFHRPAHAWYVKPEEYVNSEVAQ